MAQCYVSLADMVGRGGDHRRALRYLEDALDLQKKVVASHPSVTLYLMDLSETYYNLGYQCTQLSRRDDALRWYREAITAAEHLVALDPENFDFQDALAQAVNNHGYQLFVKGRIDESLADFRRAIDIHRRVLVKAPQSLRHRNALLYPLLNAARVKNLRGKPAEAVAAALEARSLCEGFPEFLVDIASQLSSAGVRCAEGTPDRDRYLDLAMDALREALASGTTKPSAVVVDQDFAPLRQRKEFQALVFDPTFPADPFARGD
jgi:tetratricopeptide (TPR) repeat protein